jgi:hypothetical protein
MNLITTILEQKSSGRRRKGDMMASNININSLEIFEENNFRREIRKTFLEKTRFLAAIHGKLCDILMAINVVYSLPILFNIADIFVGVTVEIFCMFFIITECPSKIMECCLVASISCTYFLKLVVVLHACVTCASEVSFSHFDSHVRY